MIEYTVSFTENLHSPDRIQLGRFTSLRKAEKAAETLLRTNRRAKRIRIEYPTELGEPQIPPSQD